MNYFVTGATGFIGRHLVELLLKREGTVYVLVREGSRGRLEELRSSWGVEEDRVVPVVGDLSQPRLGVSEDTIEELRGRIDHFFHLAAVYDMTADAETQQRSNIEGTRHAIELAEAIEAGTFHQVSSIAAAGLYKGTWREDNSRPWRVYRPGIVVGDSETGEIDKIDGPYYFFKLIQRLRNALPQWMPLAGPEGGQTNIVPVDFVARAIDHIGHLPDADLPGDTFHLVNPEPMSVGGALNCFAK